MRLYGFLAAALAVLAGAFFLPRCSPRAPLVTPMPVPKAQAIASSSAAVVATLGAKITIRPVPSNGRQKPGSANQANRAEPLTPKRQNIDENQGLLFDDPSEEITIELSQTVTSAASSSAAASASVDQFRQVAEMIPDHGRLGVILGTMPGLVALDVELVRVEIPPWLVGVPLEIGLDVAANLEAGAVGVSVGEKAYAMAGAWSTWRGDQRGLLLGAGMRF